MCFCTLAAGAIGQRTPFKMVGMYGDSLWGDKIENTILKKKSTIKEIRGWETFIAIYTGMSLVVLRTLDATILYVYTLN